MSKHQQPQKRRVTLPSESTDWTVTWSSKSFDWTWHQIVLHALSSLPGRTASLKTLYDAIEGHEKTLDREHWRAKVRQTLEQFDEFVRVEHGVWSLASKYPRHRIARFERLRRKRWPLRADRDES